MTVSISGATISGGAIAGTHPIPAITAGNILNLNFSNPTSYSGTGSTVTDLSGYATPATNGTMYNSPTYTAASPTYITCNGSNQYINVTRSDLNGGAWAYGTTTVIAWVRINNAASTGDNNIGTVEDAWEYRFNNLGNGTSNLNYASNPWAWYGPSAPVTNGVWQMLTFRHGSVNGDMWSNTTKIFTQVISGPISAGSAAYPMLTIMARTGGSGSLAMADLGSFYIYNRALLDSEIEIMFQSTRGRFGI